MNNKINKFNYKTALGGVVFSIIGSVLFLEGGYVNHPNDPGGETNHGITKTVAVSHGYTGSMKDLPKDTAIDIYFEDYINKPNYLHIIELDPVVGKKVVDVGVNTGTSRASRWYQQSLNNMSRGCKDYPCITVDGKVGPATINAHKKLIGKRGKEDSCILLLRTIEIHQGSHYLSLTKLTDFTVGWVRHRIGNVDERDCKK